MPAFNEDGIDEFLRELDKELSAFVDDVRFVVVDDASTNDMPARLAAVKDDLAGELEVVRNEENMGHGPTLARAYRLALDSGADVILQVDGDGQFEGADVHLLAGVIEGGADVAVGVRISRVDPWFRRALSRGLRVYIRTAFGVRSLDPNSPFRMYRRAALAGLLRDLPERPLVPTVYLTALAGQSGLRVVEVGVRHRVRRGAEAQGTMWGGRTRQVLIPRRLVRFVRLALVESARFALRRRSSAAGGASSEGRP